MFVVYLYIIQVSLRIENRHDFKSHLKFDRFVWNLASLMTRRSISRSLMQICPIKPCPYAILALDVPYPVADTRNG